MGRSKETFLKKQVRNKKAKKKKDKAEKRLEKKEKEKASFDDMIAYVDENGNIVDTPPETQREEVNAEDIEIGVPKAEERVNIRLRKGFVNNFDDTKGFGFITDDKTGESIFVHFSDAEGELRRGAQVEFETEKGDRGVKAVKVVVL